MAKPLTAVVLGAGVIGLTTATELLRQHPTASITVVARHLPGDQSVADYCSAWAGANWIPYEDSWGDQAAYEQASYLRFLRLDSRSGVTKFPLRLLYDDEDIKTHGKEKLHQKWYRELVGGLQEVDLAGSPARAKLGLDLTTFMINPNIYLPWLQSHLIESGVKFLRRSYDHIDDVFSDFPSATTVYNCSGLGARFLGGVEDDKVYAIKGQTMLLAEPQTPLTRMYMYKINEDEFAHVFPRPAGGGIIIGGIRLHHNYDEKPDMDLAERIKRRACEICPELGHPEGLKVIRHNVGFRPSRLGGARIEREKRNGKWLIHNYGAGGTGYQASWGMAERAVKLFTEIASTSAKL